MKFLRRFQSHTRETALVFSHLAFLMLLLCVGADYGHAVQTLNGGFTPPLTIVTVFAPVLFGVAHMVSSVQRIPYEKWDQEYETECRIQERVAELRRELCA